MPDTRPSDQPQSAAEIRHEGYREQRTPAVHEAQRDPCRLRGPRDESILTGFPLAIHGERLDRRRRRRLLNLC